MKNLIVRALSGAIYVAVIVGAVLAGGWWMVALLVLMGLAAIYEVQNMECVPGNTAIKALAYLTALTPVVFVNYKAGFVVLGVLFLLWPAATTLAVASKHGNVTANLKGTLLSAYYPMFGLMSLGLLYFDSDSTWMLVLAVLVMIWLNDTGAYIVGCTFGKHRLCERLSPKKSWEGFWGGFAFCLLGGWCATLIPDLDFLNLWQWMLMGATVSVFATVGDLFESLLKRHAGVKDSGNLIPGHGGILDRIDSLLAVAPVTLILYLVLKNIP